MQYAKLTLYSNTGLCGGGSYFIDRTAQVTSSVFWESVVYGQYTGVILVRLCVVTTWFDEFSIFVPAEEM